MNILILSWRCIKNPAAGGSELYFHELAKRWVKKGNKVTWFSPMFKGGKKKETYEGINFIRAGSTFTVYPVACMKYLSNKMGKDFDVVVDIENGIPFFTPLYMRKKTILLHVHHVHASQWFKELPAPLSWIGYSLERYLMPLIYKKRRIITISDSSAEEIVEYLHQNKKPLIVNPGIYFYKRKNVPKSKEPLVLFLNRVRKYKGTETFIKTINLINQRNNNISFIIAGVGEDLERSKKLAERLNIKNLKFVGRVSEEEKRELMAKSWVFVNPSSKEGWGIVNIEANYAGTPVVGSNVGGIKDSVVNNQTGLLFPKGNAKLFAEAIEKIISSSSLRNRMQKKGLAWSKKFSWDIKADEYLKEIKRVARKDKD